MSFGASYRKERALRDICGSSDPRTAGGGMRVTFSLAGPIEMHWPCSSYPLCVHRLWFSTPPNSGTLCPIGAKLDGPHPPLGTCEPAKAELCGAVPFLTGWWRSNGGECISCHSRRHPEDFRGRRKKGRGVEVRVQYPLIRCFTQRPRTSERKEFVWIRGPVPGTTADPRPRFLPPGTPFPLCLFNLPQQFFVSPGVTLWHTRGLARLPCYVGRLS
ncbi:hypothetical protein XENOCAPTIV_020983 [Xenoophorus captivus]|uniref:Uncharacterized protein n=1 Tax=Xenoophorus captivus TaxID=1517983 RepID=A0ABV0SI75_9TELE